MSLTRKLFSGTTQLTLSNGLVRLLSIITMPLLTRMLSPETYGLTNLVGTVISLVSVFALMGLDMSYARAYFSTHAPNGRVVEHFCWRTALSASLLIASLAAITWWYLSQNSPELSALLSIFVAFGIVVSVVQTMSTTRARLDANYRAMSLAIVLTGLFCSGISIAIAAWWRQDVFALLIPLLLSYIFPVIILGMPSLLELLKRSTLTRHEGLALINIGLAGIITAPMYWLLSSSDRWFLQYFHGSNMVGIYSIGYSIGIVGTMINNAVTAVWLPEASREYERDSEAAQDTIGRLMSRLIAIMALIWLMVTAAGGDIVRWLANERFHEAVKVVPSIAGGVFFYGILQLASTGLLLKKKLKWAIFWWLLGGILSVLLNLFLVPKLNIHGAAITQAISFAFIALGILFTSQVFFPLHIPWGRLFLALLIIVLAGALMMPPWHVKPELSLLVKMPVGVSIVILVMWLTANDWFYTATRTLMPKFFS